MRLKAGQLIIVISLLATNILPTKPKPSLHRPAGAVNCIVRSFYGSAVQAREISLAPGSPSRRQLMLLGLLVALMLADAFITRFIVAQGLGYEGNPLLGGWVVQGSFILVKLAGALTVSLILWDLHKRSQRLVLVFTFCLTAVYCAIVWWNALVAFTGLLHS
jgi:hypothetical protein